MRCPKCQTELTPVGSFWICPEHGQVEIAEDVPPAQPASPKTPVRSSIFLSYARGDDEPFVRRLYDALTARGFDVWFDRVNMPSRGLTFHQEIREAIAACDRLLLVIGPKAVSSPYVQKEWQFAWFEAEKVVTPILRLGERPLSVSELALLHCEDFRDESQFEFHLDNLVRQLADPPPRLGKLIGVPSLPAHFLTRRVIKGRGSFFKKTPVPFSVPKCLLFPFPPIFEPGNVQHI